MAKTKTTPGTGSQRMTAKHLKQPRLPGAEDALIASLEACATEYATIRDARMVLTTQETDLKKRTLALMRKHARTHYQRDGIEITIIDGDASVKVRVKKPKPEDEE